MAWFIIIGSIPGAFAGFLLESRIEKYFHTDPIEFIPMISMAIMIAFMGCLLFLADKLASHTRSLDKLSWKDSILIGLAQAMAIFPGVSRSGSTITAGLALGLERETAARFSFLLSAPIIAGSGLFSLIKIFKGFHSGAITHSEIILFPIGLIAAAVSGYFCIRVLLNFLKRNSLSVFVYYRLALAILVIAVALMRR